MTSSLISLEYLFWLFRAHRGLFVLGAGASSGATPFGADFFLGPPLDYVRGGSFPVSLPAHSPLTDRLIRMARGFPQHRVFPGRVFRPGMDDFPLFELLERMPDAYARLHLMRALSTVRFNGMPRDNYTAFRLFHPAMLFNYNLDGLANEWCGRKHQIITPHGTVPKAYGSPDTARHLEILRDHDLTLRPDALVISVPESWDDQHLQSCLDALEGCSPDFVAIIGYSFGRDGDSYDDWVSLERFNRAFFDFRGPIFVIEPKPFHLRDTIADSICSNQVFGVARYWNIVAHAFLRLACGRGGERSLNYVCEQILDRYGDRVIFPMTGDGAV